MSTVLLEDGPVWVARYVSSAVPLPGMPEMPDRRRYQITLVRDAHAGHGTGTPVQAGVAWAEITHAELAALVAALAPEVDR